MKINLNKKLYLLFSLFLFVFCAVFIVLPDAKEVETGRNCTESFSMYGGDGCNTTYTSQPEVVGGLRYLRAFGTEYRPAKLNTGGTYYYYIDASQRTFNVYRSMAYSFVAGLGVVVLVIIVHRTSRRR